MILNTHPGNRKEMVRAISELTGHEAVYKFMPTYAYEIGPVTVNKNGTIICGDQATIEQIWPMLVERGWLDETQPVAQTDDAPVESSENAEELQQEVRRMELTMPLNGWTQVQLINLIRVFYSRQRLINRMMQTDTLFIDEQFVQSLMENPIDNYVDFEDRMKRGIAQGLVCGIGFAEGKFALHAPYSQEEPTRWVAYSELLGAILKNAQEAKSVHMNMNYDPDNEKYHANMWLMRMGFAGARHKETRRVLMHHLKGFAAFKNADAMQAHKDKYSQLRREYKEAAGE